MMKVVHNARTDIVIYVLLLRNVRDDLQIFRTAPDPVTQGDILGQVRRA
jgi:hypothetical protein